MKEVWVLIDPVNGGVLGVFAKAESILPQIQSWFPRVSWNQKTGEPGGSWLTVTQEIVFTAENGNMLVAGLNKILDAAFLLEAS